MASIFTENDKTDGKKFLFGGVVGTIVAIGGIILGGPVVLLWLAVAGAFAALHHKDKPSKFVAPPAILSSVKIDRGTRELPGSTFARDGAEASSRLTPLSMPQTQARTPVMELSLTMNPSSSSD